MNCSVTKDVLASELLSDIHWGMMMMTMNNLQISAIHANLSGIWIVLLLIPRHRTL